MKKIDLDDIIEEFSDGMVDFGFQPVSQTEYDDKVKEIEAQSRTIEQEKDIAIINLQKTHEAELKELESLILPFLIKLMNSKETYIKWPHEQREKSIKSQIQKILSITRKEEE